MILSELENISIEKRDNHLVVSLLLILQTNGNGFFFIRCLDVLLMKKKPPEPFHSHPSGQVKTINSNGSFNLSGTIGFTTSDDVSWAGDKVKYQFDMGGKTVNVYNSTGVIAIIPFENFGKK